MATEKQIEANRKNAQLSTGPRSQDGKNKTRLNAMRDGITGQVITLSDEDRPVFEQLKADLIADLAPKTTMELSLANAIAWDTWRLNHLRAVEMNTYALGAGDPANDTDCEDPQIHTAMAAALTFEKGSRKFALMSIYEQRMNRNLHKNLETLRSLQAERRQNYVRDLNDEAAIARANDISELPYQAPARPTASGSVFSTREVLAAAHRLSSLEMANHTLRTAPYKVQFAGAGSGMAASLESWPKPDAA